MIKRQQACGTKKKLKIKQVPKQKRGIVWAEIHPSDHAIGDVGLDAIA